MPRRRTVARLAAAGVMGLAAMLASCVGGPRMAETTSASAPANALAAGVSPAGWSAAFQQSDQVDARDALSAFGESCAAIVARADSSGLTRPGDWNEACVAAKTWAGDPRRFFPAYFQPVRVGDGRAFATGYFEPEIAGQRQRATGYDVPVYALPPDLVRAKQGDAEPLADGRMPLGRYDENGRFTRYFDRAEIDAGALAGKGREIAWAADPVEFFFLQIQGSGRLRAPDGSVIRIGYAGQNGLAYTGIGGLMRERGLLGDGPGQYPASMQGIMQYLRENPEEGRALMAENRSWVFFRELIGDGPLGSLGVPVRGRSSVAVDPRFVPYGAPVLLDLDRAEANGLWIAQDTGGAIRGANRFDTFWGAGDEARRIAGGMSARGSAIVLLPKEAAARLGLR
jgi:membrane-bound lytic murein transglycosylase A